MRPDENRSEEWNPDVARVSQEIGSRLRARGIAVHDSDSPDDLVRLLEEVEKFEQIVQDAGGDLMVDEPPRHGAPQPDDSRFLLPTRTADESLANYLKRLATATQAARTGLRRDQAG
jgi:hypothetical protein